jgi:hypothetical protein
MAFPDLSRKDRLVQKMLAEHLQNVPSRESVFAWNTEGFEFDAPPHRAESVFPSKHSIKSMGFG